MSTRLLCSRDREICNGANPGGSWRVSRSERKCLVLHKTSSAVICECFASDFQDDPNADFIAHFNPERVAKMLDVIEAAKQHRCYDSVMRGNDRLPEALKALEEL